MCGRGGNEASTHVTKIEKPIKLSVSRSSRVRVSQAHRQDIEEYNPSEVKTKKENRRLRTAQLLSSLAAELPYKPRAVERSIDPMSLAVTYLVNNATVLFALLIKPCWSIRMYSYNSQRRLGHSQTCPCTL